MQIAVVDVTTFGMHADLPSGRAPWRAVIISTLASERA
jgi:hypothetical protein